MPESDRARSGLCPPGWGRILRRLFALVLVGMLLTGCRSAATTATTSTSTAGDQEVAAAFRDQRSGVQVSGTGTVERVLADDNDGGRHQRFILRMASGQTLLVAHNIDIAPRIPGLRVGDSVQYAGVYEWNAQGGVVHWTHHDPDGRHPAGWLKYNGQLYQ